MDFERSTRGEAAKPGGPLSGVRVVDLSTVAMGPWSTQTLGDMGADIVKVESPGGDHFRIVPPGRSPMMGAAFLNLNRNKRSIVLDLKKADDLDVMRRLVSTADVFLSNVRPKSLRKLELDPDTLLAAHPRLICCGAYGFSERGPYAGRPAYDDTIQAMSGLADLQGRHGGQPRYVNTIVADKTAALTVTWAIAMALYERERSGRGQAIEVPMFETLVAFNMVEHLAGESFVPAQSGMGYDRILSEHRRPYATKDGHVGLLPYTDDHWRTFFLLAGVPELAADPRFAATASRVHHLDALYGTLARLVAERTTAEWVALLGDRDIPFAPVATIDDVLRDPHLDALGFFNTMAHPSEGAVRCVGIPVTFSRTPGSIRSLAPGLDEHGAEIRHALAS